MFALARRHLLLATIVWVGVAAPSTKGLAALASPTAADTAAIREFWSELDSAWNARDAARFSRLFTEDASFRFVDSGRELDTRSTIHQQFSEQFEKQRDDLRHITQVESIRSITNIVAAVDGTVEVADQGAEQASIIRRFAITAVMVRDDDAWRVRLLRVYALPLAT